MNTIGGIKPLFGEGLYEVSTTQGQGYLYYDEDEQEWLNCEIDGAYYPLTGDVVLVKRKILDDQIISKETIDVH